MVRRCTIPVALYVELQFKQIRLQLMRSLLHHTIRANAGEGESHHEYSAFVFAHMRKAQLIVGQLFVID